MQQSGGKVGARCKETKKQVTVTRTHPPHTHTDKNKNKTKLVGLKSSGGRSEKGQVVRCRLTEEP